jgi:hypothetical protein
MRINRLQLMSSGALVCIALACASLPTSAAELRLNISGTNRSLDIEGRIEPGDYDRFIRIVKDSHGRLSGVRLHSPGGDFREAMKIGRALRALELSSKVPDRGRGDRPLCEPFAGSRSPDPSNCTAASAAFFIHLGGIHRGGTYLLVHRPSFDPSFYRTLSDSQAKAALGLLMGEARAYMTEMALPPHLQEVVLNTPSDRATLLDEQQIRTHVWGYLPHRHELHLAKCSSLSPADRTRHADLTKRFLDRSPLTADEEAERSRLSAIRWQEVSCGAQIDEASRMEAYERFFGTKPSDANAHEFSKWSDAIRYLGRALEDLSTEERFDPDGPPLLGVSTLTRQATSSWPKTTVMDNGMTKRVDWVQVSQPQPSQEFRDRLRAHLTSLWGPPIKDTDGLGWEKRDFRAKLIVFDQPPRSAVLLQIRPGITSR